MSKMLRLIFNNPVNHSYILTIGNLTMSLLFTIVVSLLMIATYWYLHDTLTYNKKFNITLVMLSMITTLLLALIQNNPLLSLGVLGSLSICRIRTNTKDPRDLGFVFWALSIGIASAVGAFMASLVSSFMIAFVLFVFECNKKKRHMITIVVRGKREILTSVEELFHRISSSMMQSKNVFEDTFEVVYEIKEQEFDRLKLLDAIDAMDGIHGVNVLAPETQIG